MNYYSEWEPYAAQYLRNLIDAGLIPNGHVDTRSIVDVEPSDLAGYRQCHFFAGIGGWSLAARLTGWPDDRELWTGSAPCQPFSVAGKGKAQDDDRHLWPHFLRLISARRPAVVMGEQVAAAVGKNWLDGVSADLEGIDYACRAAVVPACAVDAPHRRDRLWFVAHADNVHAQGVKPSFPDQEERRIAGERSVGSLCAGAGDVADANFISTCKEREQRGRELGGVGSHQGACLGCSVANAGCERCAWRQDSAAGNHSAGQATGRQENAGRAELRGARSPWGGSEWLIGHDGKARRVEPSIRLLAHGVPARVGRLRAYGNAIVPQVAAEVIGAYMDCYTEAL